MSAPKPPPPRRARRPVVALAALLGVALLVEGGFRIRQWVKYGIASPSFYELEEDPLSGLHIPSPGSHVGPISINSLGFRGPEIEQPKPLGRLRIAFLGGSTTFCAEASSFDATWPEQLRRALSERFPASSIDVVNGGGPGYSTRESLSNLRVRIAPLAPDVVVIYHATNDLTEDSRARAIAAGLAKSGPEEASLLARVSLAWYLIEKNLSFRARQRAHGGELLDIDPSELAEDFRSRLETLVDEAREQGAKLVVLVTFSHRARRTQAPDVLREASTSSRFYMPYLSVQTILDGFDAYNRVLREEAHKLATLLVEGEDRIPGDSVHFVDSVHFTDAGCRAQATRILEALESSPEFLQLLDTKRSEAAQLENR